MAEHKVLESGRNHLSSGMQKIQTLLVTWDRHFNAKLPIGILFLLKSEDWLPQTPSSPNLKYDPNQNISVIVDGPRNKRRCGSRQSEVQRSLGVSHCLRNASRSARNTSGDMPSLTSCCLHFPRTPHTSLCRPVNKLPPEATRFEAIF